MDKTKQMPDYLKSLFSIVIEKKKGWGKEIIIENNSVDNRCGKILSYEKDSSVSSYHYHKIKDEIFYIISGKFQIKIKDLKTGKDYLTEMNVGDSVSLMKDQPHQLTCLKAGQIFEISSFHSDGDVYRIEGGDSQK